MPILDAENIFSLRQSLVAAVGNLLSTYSIDTGAGDTLPVGFQSRGSAPHDVGTGVPVEVECKMNTDLDSAGDSATLQAQLVMADNDALTTNLTVIGQTAAIAQAVAVKGYRFAIAGTIPPGISRRYLGVRYVIAVEDVTVGTITAALVFNKQTA